MLGAQITAFSFLKLIVPSSVRHSCGRLLRALLALPGSMMIYLTSRPPRWGVIRVFYAQDRIPHRNEETHGGVVKCQWMQEVFPNSPRHFNVLYMVSSRMPRGAMQIAWVARRKGARLVWNQNGVAYPAWHGPGWERTNAPMVKLLHAADYVFYQSEFCKQSADRYLGTREGLWEILYNPVDTTVFTPAMSDPDPHHLVLLLGGTQYQFYRLATAIRTLAHVAKRQPDVRLLVTGRLCWISDETEAARTAYRLAVELGVEDRVRFLGPYTQIDAPSVYRQAHLLLHTKHCDPCPGVIIEAMACGLPVVYSHSGGVPELVGSDAGIGVPAELSWEREIPSDPEAMAEAVLEVADKRTGYAQAARQRAVEKFDLRPWLQRHREVFEALLC